MVKIPLPGCASGRPQMRNVSTPTFIQAVRDHSCTALFLSGLLTVSYEPMRLTLQELEKSGLRETVKVVIGGLVSERVRQFVPRRSLGQ